MFSWCDPTEFISEDMNHRVVITGFGVVTPIGNTSEEFWKNLVAGKNGIGAITRFDTTHFPVRIAAEVKHFDPLRYLSPKEVRRTDSFVHYAVAASKMAWENAGLQIGKEDPTQIGVWVGSGIGSLKSIEEAYEVYKERGPNRISPFLIPKMIANMAAGYVSITLGLKGPNSCPVTACATGSHAIGDAFKMIQRGDALAMVAGGTESVLTPLGIGGFAALGALSTRNDDPAHASRPFDRLRDGFILGEGAGIVVLEELEHAKKRGADIYVEVIGYGLTGDAYHPTAPCADADGATRCIQMALKDARMNPESVDYINAHGTSTELNDKTETLAIKKALGSYAKKVKISSNKSMIGHLLGAAGGVECVATVLTIKEGVIPPTINYQEPDPECDLDYVPNHAQQKKIHVALSNSFGFGGHNAILVLKAYL